MRQGGRKWGGEGVTAVTITGTNFVTGATVMFGGTGATSVVVVSATQITATTAAHAAGGSEVGGGGRHSCHHHGDELCDGGDGDVRGDGGDECGRSECDSDHGNDGGACGR